MRLTRREVLATCAAALATGAGGFRLEFEDEDDRALGFVIHSFASRRGQEGFAQPGRFLDYCRGLGVGSVQVGLGVLSPAEADALRDHARSAGMTIEADIAPPRGEADLPRFEAEIRTAKRVGVEVARTVLSGGRRYERYHSEAEFRKATDAATESLTLAARVVNREGIRLAVENHKDWRSDELIALLARVKCDRVGVCLDTGNSLALLENPAETVEALAPLAFSCHLKDMAVEESADGFLLSEVPFGAGILDLPKLVETIRRANPEIRFQIEMITRDPLKIPCLTDGYWSTFADLSGRHLARILRYVRENRPRSPLPRVAALPADERLKAEDDNNRKCVEYARERLGF